MVAAPETYRVDLPVFEGPFDLLLFFIERDELNIHDIPITKLTEDFLGYIRQMDSLNIELASEFILVAATLMRIKAKMLIPRPQLDERGEEIDPRAELVSRLLEYKKYKSVLEELEEMMQAQAERHPRTYMREEEKRFQQGEDTYQEELANLDLYTLMRAFQRIWERHQTDLRKPKHVIRPYPYTVEGVKSDLLAQLSQSPRIGFAEVLTANGERIYAVFCFLSVLELFQLRQIDIVMGTGFNHFWLQCPQQ